MRIKNPMRNYKICVGCGKQYYVENPNNHKQTKYCSKECRYKNMKKPAPRKRKEKIARKATCTVCGNEFARTKRSIYCSNECRIIGGKQYQLKYHNREQYKRKCKWCGREYTTTRQTTTCSKKCRQQARYCNEKDKRIYKNKLSTKSYTAWRFEIGERDKWICGICGKEIDKTLNYPDRMSATIDHVIPLSNGGTHTEDNVQIAHWECNCIVKKDKHIACPPGQ